MTAPVRRVPDLRTVSTGHGYPEGPCLGPDGTLYVVELAGGVVARVIDGRREVLARSEGAPNGAVVAPDGTVFFCNNGGNWGPNASTGFVAGRGGAVPRIERLGPDGGVTTVIDAIDGRPLRAPNDLVRDADGGIWFTDPAWAERDDEGRAAASASPPGGVGYVREDGTGARLALDGLVFPNGIVLTLDGGAVIVGETGTGRLLRAQIRGAGELGEPEVFAELGADAFPDGMCFDSEGRLLVAGTGSGAVFVVAPDGSLLEVLEMPDPDVTNVCFGGEDGRTVYVTEASLGRVSAMSWPVAGAPLPGSPAPWAR